jgi:CheY-like chemotaxis protein
MDDQWFFNEFLQNRNDLVLLPIADNGETLFEILHGISKSTELPDFIILDQDMPKINGLHALELLKADTRYAQIPVSIYSTYTDQDLIQTAAGNRGLWSGFKTHIEGRIQPDRGCVFITCDFIYAVVGVLPGLVRGCTNNRYLWVWFWTQTPSLQNFSLSTCRLSHNCMPSITTINKP